MAGNDDIGVPNPIHGVIDEAAGCGRRDARETLHEDEPTEEELRVRVWRFDQLVAVGYSQLHASAIAIDTTIDLELARRVVSKLGCPPELATRILI